MEVLTVDVSWCRNNMRTVWHIKIQILCAGQQSRLFTDQFYCSVLLMGRIYTKDINSQTVLDIDEPLLSHRSCEPV